MAESLDTHVHSSGDADGGLRMPENADRAAGKAGVESQRVRELPPPPKVTHDRRLPQIEAHTLPAGPRRWWSPVGRRQSSSCAVSFLFHFGLLVVLGLMVQASLPESDFRGLIAYTDSPVPLDSAAGDYQPEAVLLKPEQTEVEAVLSTRYEVPKLTDPGRRRLMGPCLLRHFLTFDT